MIEIAFFLSLDATPSQAVRTPQQQPYFLYHAPTIELPSRLRAPVRCDDGSNLKSPDGSPNWACEIHDCSPHEAVCWSDRLDFCYDEEGDDAGVCAWGEPQTCNSRWSCFDTWSGCNGQWECHESVSWVGCTDGTCTPKPRFASVPPPVFAECALESSAISFVSNEGGVIPIARDLFTLDRTGTLGSHGDV